MLTGNSVALFYGECISTSHPNRKIIIICALFCTVGTNLCLIPKQIHVHVDLPALLKYDNNRINIELEFIVASLFHVAIRHFDDAYCFSEM